MSAPRVMWSREVEPATEEEAEMIWPSLLPETRSIVAALDLSELARWVAYRRAVRAQYFNETPYSIHTLRIMGLA